MMHGNVKVVCTHLIESFGEDCPVAVLVWTLEDVLDSAECMDVTEDEAGRVLEYIAEDGDHRRYGIGREEVRDMLANLREEEAQTREVTVSATALAQVLRVAGDYSKRLIQTVFYFCPCFLPWTLSRTWTLPWTKIRLTTEDPGSSLR